MNYKCSKCKQEVGQIYLAGKEYICLKCWESVLKENLPAKKVIQRTKEWKSLTNHHPTSAK
jgi:DNA-directed RNA polymerase subunit RPC12/RpoP